MEFRTSKVDLPQAEARGDLLPPLRGERSSENSLCEIRVTHLGIGAILIAQVLFLGKGLRFAAKLREQLAPGFNLGDRCKYVPSAVKRRKQGKNDVLGNQD